VRYIRQKLDHSDIETVISGIKEVHYRLLLDSLNIVAPSIVDRGPILSKEGDELVSSFDWRPNEPERTPQFFEDLCHHLDMPGGFRLYDVHSASLFEHKIIDDFTHVNITGKADGIIVRQGGVQEELPLAWIATDTFMAIELKTHTTVKDASSFRAIVTQLVLLALRSKYNAQALLTSGNQWYFLRLEKEDNAVRIIYEIAENWKTGIGRLRYILSNFNPHEASLDIATAPARRSNVAADNNITGGFDISHHTLMDSSLAEAAAEFGANASEPRNVGNQKCSIAYLRDEYTVSAADVFNLPIFGTSSRVH
jgi:hypothetical protein